MPQHRVSMDIGGTFTDVVLYDERYGTFTATKTSTTPADLSEGVLAGLRTAIRSSSDIGFLVHGTTQGLNAFLERRGSKVLLLGTAGVEDSYHIARGPRRRLYELHYRKPEPLVPRRDVVGIGGRIDADGSERVPLDEDAVRAAARRVREEGHGAVAVALLFSYANAAHEVRVRELLHEELGDDLTVSLSHEVAREWREYERTSSAVLEAYTGPVVRNYLRHLRSRLHDEGVGVPLHVMQSSGGILTAESAQRRPLQTLLSGPVGGAIACTELSRTSARSDLIGIDMGGTSFDVSLVVDGAPDVTVGAELQGLPMLMSVVNIHTVGAGGGSIAWREAGGLRVGPRSAGASPGPACYGRGGTEPTVTDANLVLGRIDAERFAGGRMSLDTRAALAAVGRLADCFGLDPSAMAEGICDVANATMAQAIRTITVSRGIDPRASSLVAFGGAGPMHAAFLADELGIPEIVVPRFPGAFSAWGMLQTQVRRDYAEPYFRVGDDLDGPAMAAVLDQMAAKGLGDLDDESVPPQNRTVTHAADVRYAAQEYTLTIPLLSAQEPATAGFVAALAERFGAAHRSRFGHANPGAPIELVALRSTAIGALGTPAPQTWPPADGAGFPQAHRAVVFDGQRLDTLVVERDDLGAGHSFAGPAVVIESTATTIIPPGRGVTVDAAGSLVIHTQEVE